jgi:hypothetical protein
MKKRGKWPAQNFQEGRSLNGKKKKKHIKKCSTSLAIKQMQI